MIIIMSLKKLRTLSIFSISLTFLSAKKKISENICQILTETVFRCSDFFLFI